VERVECGDLGTAQRVAEVLIEIDVVDARDPRYAARAWTAGRAVPHDRRL
jgi:hypothetical protein